MSVRTILGDFIAIVALQSLFLSGFQRLVFRSPTVLEKSLGMLAFRLHGLDHCFAASTLNGCLSSGTRDFRTDGSRKRECREGVSGCD
jgi:hypothetical protein